jgi:DegV family protein with EDD domain
MQKVRVVTDSTIDLTKELIEKYNIEVVPLTISIDGESYLDSIDITPSEFIQKMRNAKDLPKSSQPAAGQFVEVYNRLASDGSDIISIHMTGGMSGTVQSAESAAKMVEHNVHVIDSRFISKALGFQVIEAAKMAQQGKTAEEILKVVKDIRDNTYLFITVDTLENLVKGGRIGKGKALIGSLLNIKPIASLEGGVYTPVTKVRSHSQIISFLTKQFTEDTKGKEIMGVGIVHADNIQVANKLKESIYNVCGFEEITVEDTTPVISTHTGPGAIGFMYYVK